MVSETVHSDMIGDSTQPVGYDHVLLCLGSAVFSLATTARVVMQPSGFSLSLTAL